MVTVVIAAGWVKNLTAGSFFSVYISDHERPNCQFLNSGSSHGSTSRHNDIEWEDLLHELPQQMFFLNLDEKSFLFHTEMAERSHFRKNLANPKLGPQKGPNLLWIGGCSLPWSLCATIIPSQIQAWYLCRDLHIPEIALYFKSERCYKLPFSYSVSSGFFQSNIWYSELVLKAGDLSAVISRVFHEQAKNFRLSNQQ